MALFCVTSFVLCNYTNNQKQDSARTHTLAEMQVVLAQAPSSHLPIGMTSTSSPPLISPSSSIFLILLFVVLECACFPSHQGQDSGAVQTQASILSHRKRAFQGPSSPRLNARRLLVTIGRRKHILRLV